MKVLNILAFAALALANPIANPPQMDVTLVERADECATKCKTNYTLCYNMCNGQQILNPGPCARNCNLKGCKVETCLKCKAFAEEHCTNLPKESS